MGFIFRNRVGEIKQRMRCQGWIMFNGGDADAARSVVTTCFDEFKLRLDRMTVPANETLLDQVMRLEQNMVLLICVEIKSWFKTWLKSGEDETVPVITQKAATESIKAIVNDLGNNLKIKIKDHVLVDMESKEQSIIIIHIETLIEDLIIRLSILIKSWE